MFIYCARDMVHDSSYLRQVFYPDLLRCSKQPVWILEKFPNWSQLEFKSYSNMWNLLVTTRNFQELYDSMYPSKGWTLNILTILIGATLMFQFEWGRNLLQHYKHFQLLRAQHLLIMIMISLPSDNKQNYSVREKQDFISSTHKKIHIKEVYIS